MIQLCKIRKPGGCTEFNPRISAPSHQDLFENLEAYLEGIPLELRYNLFYTAFHSTESFRTFKSIDIVYVDIDHIDYARINEYLTAFFSLFDLDREKTVVIATGNGLHFIILMKKTYTDKEYFNQYRVHNKVMCENIQAALKQAGLPGDVDPIFDAARIIRLPLTQNKKMGATEEIVKDATFILRNLEPQDFSVVIGSGLPEVPLTEQLPIKFAQNYGEPDTLAVLNGCDYIKWCKTDGDKVHEPHAYALFSVLGRLKNGPELCETYAAGFTSSPTMSSKHFNPIKKMQHALDSSGPRTCANISALWNGCKTCPNFNCVTSPIQIKSKEHIATEKSGFHIVKTGKNGVISYIPCYEDLMKFYDQKHTYKTVSESKMTYTWCGTHYEYTPSMMLENFAQNYFDPFAKSDKTIEFRQLIQRTRPVQQDWFNDSTHKKMNFINGVLDIDTLEFAPHTVERGFRAVLDYAYDPDAQAPLFSQMLDQITNHDEEKAQLLLEYIGYCLSNDECWVQKTLILEGEGSNGKSTFLDFVKSLVGPGNYSSVLMKDLEQEEKRSMLDGVLFNIGEETPGKALADSSVFKALVTGGELTARKLYKDSYEFKNKAKLIFSCNEVPSSHDSSKGYLRRFVIVPFNAEFTPGGANYDQDIHKKLRGERAGAINMIITAYKRLKQRGRLVIPKSVMERLEEYKSEVDYTTQWIIDQGIKENHKQGGEIYEWILLEDIYKCYALDMQDDRMFALNKVNFSKKLKKIMVDYNGRFKKVNTGHHRKTQLFVPVRIGKPISLRNDAPYQKKFGNEFN